jgi:hypothetical protein
MVREKPGGKPGDKWLEENQEENGWRKARSKMVGGKPGGKWLEESQEI